MEPKKNIDIFSDIFYIPGRKYLSIGAKGLGISSYRNLPMQWTLLKTSAPVRVNSLIT